MSGACTNVLNHSLFESNNINTFKKEFNGCQPFPLVRLESFLKKEFVSQLELSLNENVTFDKKDNDLFQFYQSYDLQLQELPDNNTAVQDLIGSLYSQEFIDLLFGITSINVSNKPDLFASCYTDTSYLLCHDDKVEDRKIAFILYLVDKNWNENDGGALNIYNSYTVENENENNNTNTNNSKSSNSNSNSVLINIFPENKPFKQLIPIRNSVVIFEVSDKSFHSVDEILTNDKNRIAIGGWWHEKKNENENENENENKNNVNINQIAVCDPIIVWNDCIKNKNANNLLQKWLNPMYLKQDSIKKLKEKFLEESHVTLMSFINEELYYKLLKQMFSIQKNNGLMDWELKGPIHRRLYYKLTEMNNNNNNNNNSNDYSLIYEFKQLTQSIEWKLFISQITCLDLLKYNNEIRRFDHGHYTIAHDLDRFKDIAGLDLNIQFIENEQNGWDTMCGGSIYYTLAKQNEINDNEVKDEQHEHENSSDNENDNEIKEEQYGNESDNDNDIDIENDIVEDDNIIMSIHPFPNTLSITYRSECGIISFVKYINHKAPCSKIDFNQVWTVQMDDVECSDLSDQDINQKKRKFDEHNNDSNDEPQHKKQKM